MVTFASVQAYKCTDGKILTPKSKESKAKFKSRVREYELMAQIIKNLGKYFPPEYRRDVGILGNRRVALKTIAKYRNELLEVLDEKNYNVIL